MFLAQSRARLEPFRYWLGIPAAVASVACPVAAAVIHGAIGYALLGVGVVAAAILALLALGGVKDVDDLQAVNRIRGMNQDAHAETIRELADRVEQLEREARQRHE